MAKKTYRMRESTVLTCIISGFFLFGTLNAQQLVSLNGAATASSSVGGRQAQYVTDGKDYPDAPNSFCETNTKDYNWIQISLPNGYRIAKVVLMDGNFSNKGEFNTNLMVTASNNAGDFSSYDMASDPASFVSQAGLKYQRLNNISGDQSETVINQNISGSIVRIWDMDGGGIRLAEIKIYGGSSSAAIPANGTNGNNGQTSPGGAAIGATAVVATGVAAGTLSTDEKIRQAISKKDNAALNTLLKEEPGSFTQQHVDEAFVNGQVDQGTRISTVTGIKPSANALNNMIQAGKASTVLSLLNNGVIEGTTAMLNTSLTSQQASLVSYLSKRVKPNSETFALIATQGNTDLFEELIDNDNRVPDNKSINIAIDQNNTAIVNLGLNNGGNANEALSYAITKGNVEMVKLIASKKGVDANKAFKFAVEKNDEALFRSLLALSTADVRIALDEAIKAKNTDFAILALETKKTNPTKYLVPAVETGNTILAKKIVETGGDANEGMEAAIGKNNLELVEFFVGNGATTSNPKYLAKAAVAASLEIIRLLVENGAGPDYGIEPAALNGRENVVEYLLGKGADPNKGISAGAQGGNLEVVKMLVEKGANATKGVEPAVTYNHADVLNYLVGKRADLSSSKLIPIAVSKNYTEIFRLLAENGSPVAGAGLMQTASGNGNMVMVETLLKNKFNADDGMLPAIQKNRAETVKFLLENGAVMKDNYAAEAVNSKAAAVIPVLAASGADFSKQDGLGNTFLHTAVTNNDAASVEALIKAGIGLDVQNVKGNTALHIAAESGERINIIMLLAKAGANLNLKNKKGDTPKDVAPNFSKTKKALKDLGAQ